MNNNAAMYTKVQPGTNDKFSKCVITGSVFQYNYGIGVVAPSMFKVDQWTYTTVVLKPVTLALEGLLESIWPT